MNTHRIDDILSLTFDQFGRAIADPDAIRAGIPAWHPRNDGEGAGAGGSGEGGSGEGGTGGSGEGGGQGGTGGSGEGGSGGGSGDGWTPPSKAEWDNLQRQQRETAANLKKITDAEAERQRKADEEAGNFKDIAAREKARAEAAEKKADDLAAERQTEVRERRVERIAARLKFRDAGDVLHRISAENLDDDSKVEKALKDLAKEKPYLVTDGEKPKTRDLGGGDGGDGGSGGQGGGEATGVDRLSRAYAASSSNSS